MSRYNKTGNKSPLKIVLLMVLLLGISYLFKDTIMSASHQVANADSVNYTGDAIRDAVRAEIEQYLEEKPEVIINAIKKFQQNEMDKESKESNEAIKKHKSELEDSKNFPFLGTDKAKNVIVQFFDYNCGYCQRSAEVLKSYIEKHKDTKVVLIDFPILGDNSVALSKIAATVFKLKPEKYSDFYFKLINEAVKNEETAKNAALSVGISSEAFDEAMKSSFSETYLNKTRTLGMDLKVRGTPFLIINGMVYNSSLDVDAIETFIKGESK